MPKNPNQVDETIRLITHFNCGRRQIVHRVDAVVGMINLLGRIECAEVDVKKRILRPFLECMNADGQVAFGGGSD